jgi:hypothetical protein
MDWIDLTHVGDYWMMILVIVVKNLEVPQNIWKFLRS